MLKFKKDYRISPGFDNQEWLIVKAEEVLTQPIPHITDAVSPRSKGDVHDYYSDGDYWWPNPDTADGLPYVRRDGETNPDNFDEHRILLRRMRTYVAAAASAYRCTGKECYASQAVTILKEFFLDEETCMNPHLSYAQAIAGVCTGRGIGIIDTIHLADIPFAIEALRDSKYMTDTIYNNLKTWFSTYLGWMLTSSNGIEEMNTDNNHCVCFFMQASVFALFTDNEQIVDFCREQFKQRLLPQMAEDGSFPLELARTKPYNYSAFIIDNMITICFLLSKPEDNLWDYQTADGRNIRKALEFMAPYILDKGSWPYPPDIMHFEAFPVRYSFLLFAGYVLGIPEYISFYQSLAFESADEEARRNLAVRQPELWY